MRPHRVKQDEFPYHITTRTNNREFRFVNKKKVIKAFAKVIFEASKKYEIKIFHFILLSNHYHLLCQTAGENIDRAFQYINSRVALWYNKLNKRTGHLWEKRYHSSIIEDEKYYERAIHYIYNNAVRAGISTNPEDYDASTITFYAFGKRVDIVLTEDSYYISMGKNDEIRRRAFLDLVNYEKHEEELEKTKYGLNNRFFGSFDFVKDMVEKYCPG
ncbi:MAG: transposase [Pseudomonadota bacterium]